MWEPVTELTRRNISNNRHYNQEPQRTDREAERAEQELQRANLEQQRADKLAQKLRSLGIDPEQG